MDSETIIRGSSKVPIEDEPSSTLTLVNLSLESPKGTFNLLGLPPELRNKIYQHTLEIDKVLTREALSTQYPKRTGWGLSHQFNFALLRVNKQVYEEASEIVYSTLSLILIVTDFYGPEWLNLNLHLPGTTHIRVCEVHLAVRVPFLSLEAKRIATKSAGSLILRLREQLNRMPHLEKVHMIHTGTIDSFAPMELDLDIELKIFCLLKDRQDVSSYEPASNHSVPEKKAGIRHTTFSVSDPMDKFRGSSKSRYGRAFTCHLQRL